MKLQKLKTSKSNCDAITIHNNSITVILDLSYDNDPWDSPAVLRIGMKGKKKGKWKMFTHCISV